MDLRAHLRLVRRQWWLVLASIMIALGLAALVTVRTQPRYVASVTFFVTAPSEGISTAYQGSLFLTQRVESYADLLTSDRLVRSVVADNPGGLSVEQVRKRIRASAEEGTVLLTARVTDTDKARALKLTESLAVRFRELVREVETPPGQQTAPVKIEVVTGPQVDPTPVSPKPVRNLALGVLLGLLAGLGLSQVRGLIDTRLRDGATLQQLTGGPLLGEIPFDPEAKTAPLLIGAAAHSPRAEAVRKLRTNLRFVDVHEPARVIAVTSAVQGEGKTTLSCNLAITLSEAGWRVLLIDADLRRPRAAEYLGLEAGIGLTDVLVGDVQVGDVVQPWGDKSLLVLPSGSTPPNPSELLGSKAMADLLLALRDSVDIVIIDTAPLLAVTDGVVVAVQADGAILVAQEGRTSTVQASAAARALHSVSVRMLGCVLNMAKVDRSAAYGYETYRISTAALASAASAKDARASTTVAPRHSGEFRTLPVADATQEFSRLP